MGGNYNLKTVKRAFKDPIRFHNELRKTNRKLNAYLYKDQFTPGFDVIEADWDNLIILDGCRYDVFEGAHSFDGETSSIISQGAHSNEFMQNTLWGQDLKDTVYITANPWSEQIDDDVFFLIRTTYSDDERGGKARLPEDVAELATQTFKKYPDKRYILHFMQPNNPYVGSKAREYRKQILETKGVLCTEMDTPGAENNPTVKREIQHLRRALRRGYISREMMLEVYRENLGIVTEHAKKVMQELGGKTAITSDHGDMFGERLSPLRVKEYSHWEGVYNRILREVPWVVTEGDERRDITADEPLGREKIDHESLQSHLEAMGYLGD